VASCEHKMLPSVLNAAQRVRAKTVATRMGFTDRQTDRHTDLPQSRVLIVVQLVKRMALVGSKEPKVVPILSQVNPD